MNANWGSIIDCEVLRSLFVNSKKWRTLLFSFGENLKIIQIKEVCIDYAKRHPKRIISVTAREVSRNLTCFDEFVLENLTVRINKCD